MYENYCPLCGRKYIERNAITSRGCRILDPFPEGNYRKYYCHVYEAYYFLHDDIVEADNEALQNKLLNLIVEHLLHSRFCIVNREEHIWHFYYDGNDDRIGSNHPEYFNLSNSLRNYPNQVLEQAHRSLVNVSLYFSAYGDTVEIYQPIHRIAFNNSGMMEILKDLGYVKGDGQYRITVAGWQKIEGLKKEEQVVRQAFVAMIFREEASSIREAFRQAIHEMGYQAVVLDEKEHNNQIVPEIFYEIKRSKFVVVDVTYPSYGAYYEAGYAQALDKEVIICCRKDVFSDKNRAPHFDISQKAIIVWEDEEDLVSRLKRRIESTVT